jgi:FixJ family two-component response regulator
MFLASHTPELGVPSFSDTPSYSATSDRATVIVVDDDPGVLMSIVDILSAIGYNPLAFSTPKEFLAAELPAGPHCMVLDYWLPEITGAELQEEIERRGISIPIVFMTAKDDTKAGVSAMKRGAIDYLLKPFDAATLLNAVARALKVDVRTHATAERVAAHQHLFDTLTPRERDVFAILVRGFLNKQVAASLGVTERTVKAHRGRITQKLRARSMVDLVRIADDVDLGGLS